MAVRAISTGPTRLGDFEFLAAGTYDLTARPGKPARCARRVVAMVAGNWTMLRNSGDVDSPAGAVFQGFTLDGDVSAITCSAAIMVSWG
jgi:hypothetical protein